jgi:cytidine deaminase
VSTRKSSDKKNTNRRRLLPSATVDAPVAVAAVVEEAYRVAKRARENAHAPYSKFKVGAAVVTRSGDVLGGCNVENASYGGTVCAERVAIFKAVSEGDAQIDSVVVVTDAKNPASPCALCLQVMAEFLDPEALIHVADLRAIRFVYKFRELLPVRFGPSDLKLAVQPQRRRR